MWARFLATFGSGTFWNRMSNPTRSSGGRRSATNWSLSRRDGPAERRLPERHDDVVIGDIDHDVVRVEPPEPRRLGGRRPRVIARPAGAASG